MFNAAAAASLTGNSGLCLPRPCWWLFASNSDSGCRRRSSPDEGRQHLRLLSLLAASGAASRCQGDMVGRLSERPSAALGSEPVRGVTVEFIEPAEYYEGPRLVASIRRD